MPLIIGITSIGVPSLLYLFSLLSLTLFGYEFNFFHLISFRKSQQQQPQAAPSVKPSPEVNEQLVAMLAKLSLENERLIADKNQKEMLESTRKLIDAEKKAASSMPVEFKQLRAIEPACDEENLNNSLANNFDTFISNLNTKEEEYRQQINALKAENESLKQKCVAASPPPPPPPSPLRKDILMDQSGDGKESITHNSTPNNSSKVVSIGLSKTVVMGNKMGAASPQNRQNSAALLRRTKERELLQESNDSNTAYEDTEDDEEDIFVILDEENSRG